MEFKLVDIFAEIDAQAGKFGVNPRTAKSVFLAENSADGSIKKTSYRADAESPAGARGLMQVMPATARGLQKAGFLPPEWKYDPSNLSSSVAAGLAALKEKQGRMNNPDDLAEVASVYNGSSATHKMYKAGNIAGMPAETKQYIEKLRRANMELDRSNSTAEMPSRASIPATSTSGSVRTATRRSVSNPGTLDAFTNSILAMTSPGGTFDVTEQVLKDQASARELASGNLVAAIAAQASAAGAEAMAKASTLGVAAARKMQILRDMNLDPAANNNAMMKAMGVIQSADTKLATMKPDIDARMAVGFFDNPLEWLVNQTRLPGMVAKYNSTVDNKNNAAASYKKQAQIASTQAALSSGTEADSIMREGRAIANSAAAKAVADAQRLNIESAGAIGRDAATLLTLEGQRTGLLGQLVNATKQSVTESTGMTDRQKSEKEVADTLASINKVIVMAGGEPVSELKFKQMSSDERTGYIKKGSSNSFGKDFSESFAFVYGSGSRSKLAVNGGAGLVTWMDGTNKEAGALTKTENDRADMERRKFNPKTVLLENLNAMQNKYEQEAGTNMRNASKYNPFKIDYVGISKAPELKSNALALWINRYGPRGTEPIMGTIDEQYIINKFAQSVVEGQMLTADAAKTIADYYQFATKQQARNTNWSLFGLSKPEQTYVVKLDGARANSIDFGDIAQVERTLTVAVSKSIAATAASELGSGLLFTAP